MQTLERSDSVKYTVNKTVNALLESIEKTGGIDKETADLGLIIR
jgi:hypothetical protein